MRHIGRTATVALAAGLLAPALVVAPAQAKGGQDDRVQASGTCAGGGTWKLTAKPDDGRLEIELEVDTNRIGQRWAVAISDDGRRVFRGYRTTLAPSGSFSVERSVADRAGQNVIRAVAVRGDRRCAARITI